MPEKQKSAQKSRESKTSQGTARGARRTILTPTQKILLGGRGLTPNTQKGMAAGFPARHRAATGSRS